MKAVSHYKHIIRFYTLLLIGCLALSFANQTNNHFVQFRVLTIPDAETAKQIDQKMGSKSGFVESRADHITSTYFCLLSPDAGYTEEDFKTWFAKLGFEIACYTKGVQNTDAMISPHVLKNCTEESSEKE
jgi:hypothetical protein